MNSTQVMLVAEVAVMAVGKETTTAMAGQTKVNCKQGRLGTILITLMLKVIKVITIIIITISTTIGGGQNIGMVYRVTRRGLLIAALIQVV